MTMTPDEVRSKDHYRVAVASETPVRPRKRSGRTAVSSPDLHRMQVRHFVLFDVLPFLGTIGAVAFLFVQPLTAVDVALFFLMWAFTGMAITVGFHRLFTHRAFKT